MLNDLFWGKNCLLLLLFPFCLDIGFRFNCYLTNWLVAYFRPQMFRQPVVFMGADVTHPPAGDKSRPSLAAVSVRNTTNSIGCLKSCDQKAANDVMFYMI